MDHLEHRCLAGSRPTGKDAERIMDGHLHGFPLRGIELQPGTAPISIYRCGNDGGKVAREQISLGAGYAREQRAEITCTVFSITAAPTGW